MSVRTLKDFEPLIIYADNHLLVLNKPAGMLTQDSGTGRFNLEDWARNWIKETKQKPGRVFLETVHRIDRPVSGVVLMARTSKALSRLHQAVRDRKVVKSYRAVVEGCPEPPAAGLKHWMRHKSHRSEICSSSDAGAKEARLKYRTIQASGKYALLDVDLQTGRYHQIRLQLSHMGHPIVGDSRYGSSLPEPAPGAIALHHFRMEILHPVRKEPLRLEAVSPAYFESLLAD